MSSGGGLSTTGVMIHRYPRTFLFSPPNSCTRPLALLRLHAPWPHDLDDTPLARISHASCCALSEGFAYTNPVWPNNCLHYLLDVFFASFHQQRPVLQVSQRGSSGSQTSRPWDRQPTPRPQLPSPRQSWGTRPSGACCDPRKHLQGTVSTPDQVHVTGDKNGAMINWFTIPQGALLCILQSDEPEC